MESIPPAIQNAVKTVSETIWGTGNPDKPHDDAHIGSAQRTSAAPHQESVTSYDDDTSMGSAQRTSAAPHQESVTSYDDDASGSKFGGSAIGSTMRSQHESRHTDTIGHDETGSSASGPLLADPHEKLPEPVKTEHKTNIPERQESSHSELSHRNMSPESGDYHDVDAPAGPTGGFAKDAGLTDPTSRSGALPPLAGETGAMSGTSMTANATKPAAVADSSATTGALGGGGPATAVEPSADVKPEAGPETKHQGANRPTETPDDSSSPLTHHKSQPLVATLKHGEVGGSLPKDDNIEEGTGTKYERSTGLAAEGGDFDATRPGAGREADRLLDEEGVQHGAAMGKRGSASEGSSKGIHGLGEKLKDKLHIGSKHK